MERHSYTFEWGNAQFSGHNYTSDAAARRAQMRKIRELAESDPLPRVRRTVEVRCPAGATA